MGTNYYARVQFDGDHELHIGKSSWGWKFGFHAIPELNLETWEAWRKLLNTDGVTIWDEYGVESPWDEFFFNVMRKQYSEPSNMCRVNPDARGIEAFGGQERFEEARRWFPAYHDLHGFDFNVGEFC